MDSPNRFLIVSLEGERFAIPIENLVEITVPRRIQKDPTLDGRFEGKLEYRNTTIPVADLKKMLKMPGKPGGSLLVVKTAKGSAGFLVDTATELLAVAAGPAPLPRGIMQASQTTYGGVLRAHDDLVLLLNVEGLSA